MDLQEVERTYRDWGITVGTATDREGRVPVCISLRRCEVEELASRPPEEALRMVWWAVHAMAFDPSVQSGGAVLVEDMWVPPPPLASVPGD